MGSSLGKYKKRAPFDWSKNERSARSLLNSPYTEDSDPIPLLRSALRNLSRETILLIYSDRLEWSPSNRTEIIVEGKTVPVSEIDIQGITVLKSRVKLGTGRGRRKDNFIKVNW